MLAACGADVGFTYRKREDEAERTLELINDAGRRGVALLSSVDSASDNVRAVAEIEASLGPVDILINNAGIVSGGHPVADTTSEEFRRLMEVHAFGPAQLCQLALPHMRAMGRGDIVMISSVAALECAPLAAPYTMAKCAQEALALTLAAEERTHGIKINVVAPGLIDTDMGRRLVQARPDDFTDDPSTPEQVASIVRSVLCSSDVTGQRLAIAAGRVTSQTSHLPML
jgi:NAD(P)-dependent dehydrogenase (short-subunit alcohol dehydrogenase family)